MTVKEMLSLFRSLLNEVRDLRYEAGTTTSAGASNGTTFICSSLAGVDDAYNEAEVRITSGNNAGQRREIGDWVDSTNTGTVVKAFTHQIATAINFEIGEKGFVSDHQAIELFTKAQDKLISFLPAAAFPGHTSTLEVGGTGGVSNAMPSTLAGPPKTLRFKDTSNVEYDVLVLGQDEHNRFRNDPFWGTTLEDAIAIWDNGKILYRPTDNGTLLLPVVPKFDAVTFSGGCPFPGYLHELVVDYAVYRAWLIKGRADMAGAVRQDVFDTIVAINQQHGNVIKSDEKKKL